MSEREERTTPARARSIGAVEASTLAERADVVFVDVREPEEVAAGAIPGSVKLPKGRLETEAEAALPDRARTLVLYCETGARSLILARQLARHGYRDARTMTGGYRAWLEHGLPVEGAPSGLSGVELRRYARHLSIPEVGPEGQCRLKEARVLLVGAGGLGSPAAVYLACAGVGTLGIVDSDVVDESNLQRQILHDPSRLGVSKTESARRTIEQLNPLVTVETFPERLTSDNADRIVPDFDVVVDGADNFPTRYLLNDACVKHDKPNVHGSVYRFEGQASVFRRGRGPCYRCLYPRPPPPEMTRSCAEAGVLGVLPGVIGLLQAVEAIKLILGKGDPLYGRLLVYDALAGSFRELRAQAREDCEYCGPGRPFPGYVDYVGFCSGS